MRLEKRFWQDFCRGKRFPNSNSLCFLWEIKQWQCQLLERADDFFCNPGAIFAYKQ